MNKELAKFLVFLLLFTFSFLCYEWVNNRSVMELFQVYCSAKKSKAKADKKKGFVYYDENYIKPINVVLGFLVVVVGLGILVKKIFFNKKKKQYSLNYEFDETRRKVDSSYEKQKEDNHVRVYNKKLEDIIRICYIMDARFCDLYSSKNAGREENEGNDFLKENQKEEEYTKLILSDIENNEKSICQLIFKKVYVHCFGVDEDVSGNVRCLNVVHQYYNLVKFAFKMMETLPQFLYILEKEKEVLLFPEEFQRFFKQESDDNNIIHINRGFVGAAKFETTYQDIYLGAIVAAGRLVFNILDDSNYEDDFDNALDEFRTTIPYVFYQNKSYAQVPLFKEGMFKDIKLNRQEFKLKISAKALEKQHLEIKKGLSNKAKKAQEKKTTENKNNQPSGIELNNNIATTTISTPITIEEIDTTIISPINNTNTTTTQPIINNTDTNTAKPITNNTEINTNTNEIHGNENENDKK